MILSHTLPSIKGQIHSCISTDISDHLFLIDDFNFYKFSIKNKSSKVFESQNCVGLYVVDNKFCYTLSHSGKDGRSSGLRLYDLNNLLIKNSDTSYVSEESEAL